jgi:hypothetical protein
MTQQNPFGTDWSTFVDGVPDLDPTFATLTDPQRELSEHFARRLTTRRGSFSDDPDAGTDVRQYCQARMSPLKLAQMRQAVESECLKDERCSTVTATVTFEQAASRTRIQVSGEGSAGRFAFVLSADQMTVELLNTPS